VPAAPSPSDSAGRLRRFGSSGFPTKLACVTALGLLIRILYIVAIRPHRAIPSPDGFLYHQGANLLARGHGFIDPYEFARNHVVKPAADHPPAYLLYLAMYSAVGLRSPMAHMLASALLGAAAIAMTGLVGREVGGPRIGLAAAGFAAVYPGLVLADGALQAESMAVLVVTTFTYAALRYRSHPTVVAAAGLGALVGWAGLTRPEQYLLIVVVAVAVWRAVLGRRQRWTRMLVAGAVCAAMTLPWAAYNATRFDHPVLLSTNLDYTIATTNCHRTWYGQRIGFWDNDCNVDALKREGMTFHSGDQSERSLVWRRAGLHYLGDHVDRVPVVLSARVLRLVSLWDPITQMRLDNRVEGRELGLAAAAIVSFYLLLALAVAGIVGIRRNGGTLVELTAPMVIVALSAVLFMGNARYRVPAEGVLCVLAAVGNDFLRRQRATERSRTEVSATEIGFGADP
jgi:4-amino-4-deoxy-L-arabinose transferase-like glycosyltransferase